MSDPPERERPIRDRKPIVRFGVQENWHDEIDQVAHDPPEEAGVRKIDANWVPPRPTAAARPETGDPARPPGQGGGAQGRQSPLRHNLLGNQDGRTSPRHQRNDMQPCPHCTGTDHAQEECDRALLKCDICYVNGHNTAACDVNCIICKKSGLHLEKDCAEYQQPAPLLSSSPPPHAETKTVAEGSGTQGDGTGSTHTTRKPPQGAKMKGAPHSNKPTIGGAEGRQQSPTRWPTHNPHGAGAAPTGDQAQGVW